MNTTVSDFLLNAAAYLRRVLEGEQVCLIEKGKVQARITPEKASVAENSAIDPAARDWILQARQLKAQLAAKHGADDWTPQDYLTAGRRS
jgi:antitoxin (DNA-binding transcriptional repressor) of toxin-antitoxin stability system